MMASGARVCFLLLFAPAVTARFVVISTGPWSNRRVHLDRSASCVPSFAHRRRGSRATVAGTSCATSGNERITSPTQCAEAAAANGVGYYGTGHFSAEPPGCFQCSSACYSQFANKYIYNYAGSGYCDRAAQNCVCYDPHVIVSTGLCRTTECISTAGPVAYPRSLTISVDRVLPLQGPAVSHLATRL